MGKDTRNTYSIIAEPLFDAPFSEDSLTVLGSGVDTISEILPPIEEPELEMIVPEEVWKNTVISFEHLNRGGERRSFPRVCCFGEIALSNSKGKIVAVGDLRDINEKSACFEIKSVDLSLSEVFYLEFMGPTQLMLAQTTVVLKRVQLAGSKTRVAVEYIDPTLVFQDRLDEFLAEKRADLVEFDELETI